LNQCELRKEAYRYILEILRKLPVTSISDDSYIAISLDELMQLKEGIANPSPELINMLRKLLKGTVTEAEFNSRLVEPFGNQKQ
jgi:hypothetical protein